MASCARVRCRAGTRAVRALAATTVLVTLSLGAAPSHAGASTTTTPLVRLLHVTPVITKSGAPMTVTLTRTGPALAAGATVRLTLYSRLTTRSSLLTALSTQGPSGPVSTTGSLEASCLVAGSALRVGVRVAPVGAKLSHHLMCGKPAPVLRLGPGGADGVYPLRITVRGGGQAATLDTLVTYATVASSAPLRLAWLLRVTGGDGGLAGAIPALQALGSHPRVPVTIDVRGSTVALAPLGTPGSLEAIGLLKAAVAQPAHELVPETYVAAELGTLRASHLPDEVMRQFALTDVSLATVHVTTLPSSTDTYGTGPQTPTSTDALASSGYHHVVIPGTALSVDPASTLSWGAAFRVGGSPSGATALASDTELSMLSDTTTADPGLVGANFLGELAFLHFEQPNLPDPRAVVVVTNATPLVTSSFVSTVLSGLAANPVVVPVTEASAFRLVPLGANGFPAVRDLALGPSTPYPGSTIRDFRHLRITTDALSSAVRVGTTPIPAIEGELLSAEQVLAARERRAIMNAVQEALEDQLGYFRIYDGPITLTQSGASLPITIFSTAPYDYTGVLRLTSPKLTFAHRSIKLVGPVGSVYSLRVQANALVTGDIPLTATLWSPKGNLKMATAVITVRATQTSIVGIALTVVAVLVLAWWWVRTSRRRRAKR